MTEKGFSMPDQEIERLRAALRQTRMSLDCIVEIIEAVDNRCLAVDGPVTPTRLEMTDEELRDIFVSALTGVNCVQMALAAPSGSAPQE